MRFDKSSIENLAQELLTKHGLTEWRFEWDKAKRRLGCCKYHPKLITISLPNAQLNAQEVSIDTLKHEIAHALTPKDRGHGQAWKLMALALGARPERCAGPEIEVVKGKLRAVCGECKKEFFRHRPTKKQLYCLCCRHKVIFDIKAHLLKFQPCPISNVAADAPSPKTRQSAQQSAPTQMSLF